MEGNICNLFLDLVNFQNLHVKETILWTYSDTSANEWPC